MYLISLKSIRLVLTLLTMMSLSGCGYFSDDPVQEEVIDARDSLGTCDFDIEQLKLILEKDVTNEINCLEQNIESFERFVKRENRNYIKRNELKSFVEQYFSSDSEVLGQSIDIVFTLNELLLKDEDGLVAKENVAPLFEILRQSNQSFSKLTKLLRDFDDKKVDFIDAGAQVKKELKVFAEKIRTIIIAPGITSDSKLDLVKFVADVQQSFGVLKDYDEKTIASFLAVKRLMLGGESGFLTRPELFDTLDKLPDLGKVFFSVLKGEESTNDVDGNDYVLRLRESLKTVENQFYPHRREDKMIDDESIDHLIEFFADEDSVDSYKTLLSVFRRYLLNDGRRSSSLDFRDIKNLFTFAKVFLDSATFYEKYKVLIKDQSDWEKDDWELKRRKFISDITFLEKEVALALTDSNSLPQRYLFRDFFDAVSEEIDDLPLSTDMISIAASAKVLFFGGRDDVLTNNELISFVEKLDELAGSLFDLAFANKETHPDGSLTDLYFLTIENLEKDFFPHRRQNRIMDSESLDQLIELIVKDEDDLKKYKRTLESFRKNLLNDGLDPYDITFRDIRNTISYAKVYLDLSDYYERYKKLVEDKDKWTIKQWKQKRAEFLGDFLVVGVDVEKTLTGTSDLPRQIFWLDFIKEVSGDFPEFELDDEMINFISIAKIFLAGGEKEVISSNEIFEVIDNMESIGESAFDLLFANDKNHAELDLKQTRYKAILKLQKSLTKNSFALVSDLDSLLEMAADHFDNKKILDFEPSIRALAGRLIGFRGNDITVDDVRRVLKYAEDYMGIVYYMGLSSYVYRSPLSWDQMLTRLRPRYKEDNRYKDFSADKFKEYDALFRNVIFNYRIFKNKLGFQVYDDKVFRTVEGITELAYVKWGIEELMSVYGSRSGGKFSMTADQINVAMFEVRPILEYLGMWSNNPETFARNVMLLSDLFQGQSDGSTSVNSDEGAEFIALVFSATEMAGRFETQLKKLCKSYRYRGESGYQTACFRKHFYNLFMNKIKMSRYLKKFNRYYTSTIKAKNYEELNNLLVAVEGFARDFGPNYPVTKKDLTMIIGAFLNIESVFVRFDLNRNNILSNEELRQAFPIYKEALMAIGDISEDDEKYALPSFMYIIGEGKIPSPRQVFVYATLSNGPKKVTAKRLNIGQLLYNMVQAADSL